MTVQLTVTPCERLRKDHDGTTNRNTVRTEKTMTVQLTVTPCERLRKYHAGTTNRNTVRTFTKRP